MKIIVAVLLMMSGLIWSGCSTPSHRITDVRLGMTPDEVLDTMGRPYAVRSAKLYRDGSFQEVWEYIPSIFSVALFADRYDKTYWVYFDDGRVAQWGEPGDLAGTPTVQRDDAVVVEYMSEKRTR